MCVDSVLFELMSVCKKAYYLSTPHLARSRTPKYLYKCVRARALVCVSNEGECMRERERERAIHVLMIHSIFVMLLFLSFFLYFTYSISILDSLQN